MTRRMPIDVTNYPRLSAEDETKYIMQYQNATNKESKQEACDVLVYHNMGLIYKVINAVCKEPRDRDDLVSYGVEGFILAIGKYDLNSNAKLTTYAYNWIFKKVVEGKRANHLVQFPENIWDGISKYYKAAEKYRLLNDAEPTNRPFSDEAGFGFVSDMERMLVLDAEEPMTLSQYKSIISAIDKLGTQSIDAPVSEDNESNLSDYIEDKTITSNNFQNELSFALQEAFEKMGKAFGSKGSNAIKIFNLKLQGLSSAEIQRELNISRSVERTLEAKGMEFLRNSANLRELSLEIC